MVYLMMTCDYPASSFSHSLSTHFLCSLQETRTKLYSLLANCIPADIILKNIAFEFMNSVDAEMKPKIIGFAAEYEHRMRIGSKAIFHLEAFCAKIMSVYAAYLMSF